jgi:hypothetical protein
MKSVMKHWKIRKEEIKKNNTINLFNFQELKGIKMEEFTLQRQDIWV